nr:MAG TPA: PORTAL PROTEIN, 15 PROTEIN, HEAD PROTEIN, VIRAL INFECTION, TAILED.2A [Bacteriophage sp.]
MIITLERYKELAGIETSGLDARISALIPVVEDDFLSIRGKAFDTAEDGTTVYPEGSTMVACEMIGFRLLTLKGSVGVVSETIGDYSVGFSNDMLLGYPRSIVQKIRRYARVK